MRDISCTPDRRDTRLRYIKKVWRVATNANLHRRVLRRGNQKLCTFLDSVRQIKRVSLLSIWRHRLAVRTQALHACNPGSNPGGVTSVRELWTERYALTQVQPHRPKLDDIFKLVVTTVLRVIHTNERNNRCYSRQGQRD